MSVDIEVNETGYEVSVEYGLDASEQSIDSFMLNQLEHVQFGTIDYLRSHVDCVNAMHYDLTEESGRSASTSIS